MGRRLLVIVYLDADVREALLLESTISGRSVSDLVNQACRVMLAEDEADLRAVDERSDEPSRPFDAFLKEFDD